jgi:hypothetical protein
MSKDTDHGLTKSPTNANDRQTGVVRASWYMYKSLQSLIRLGDHAWVGLRSLPLAADDCGGYLEQRIRFWALHACELPSRL